CSLPKKQKKKFRRKTFAALPLRNAQTASVWMSSTLLWVTMTLTIHGIIILTQTWTAKRLSSHVAPKSQPKKESRTSILPEIPKRLIGVTSLHLLTVSMCLRLARWTATEPQLHFLLLGRRLTGASNLMLRRMAIKPPSSIRMAKSMVLMELHFLHRLWRARWLVSYKLSRTFTQVYCVKK